MIDLIRDLKETIVPPGSVAVCSLGQAGFVYKLPSDRYIVVDPYLTDYCERQIGLAFKRLTPSLITPEELETLPLAAYLMTHHHEDHLDADCVTRLRDGRYDFYAPPETIRGLAGLGVGAGRCKPLFDGSEYGLDGFVVNGVFADHGEGAPDAVGIVVRAEGKTVYHMGDTCLDETRFAGIAEAFDVDLLLAPINGKYGNMTERDAVKAVSTIRPRYAAPCHFWMLPGNSGGDPAAFLDGVGSECPETTALLLAQGEIFIV